MSDTKKSAWDGYRRWRMIACVAVPVAVYLLCSRGSTLLAIPLGFISGTALIAIGFFQCPKCGEPFFFISALALKYKDPFFRCHRPFAQKCVHCDFPKWEEPPEKACSPSRVRIPGLDSANAERTSLTNFLTLVLRDDPRAIGLRLDSAGWADVDHLFDRANRYGIKLTRENLAEVLSDSENHRFEWDQAGNRIRVIPN